MNLLDEYFLKNSNCALENFKFLSQVLGMGFEKTIVYRPAVLLVTREESRFGEKIAQALASWTDTRRSKSISPRRDFNIVNLMSGKFNEFSADRKFRLFSFLPNYNYICFNPVYFYISLTIITYVLMYPDSYKANPELLHILFRIQKILNIPGWSIKIADVAVAMATSIFDNTPGSSIMDNQAIIAKAKELASSTEPQK